MRKQTDIKLKERKKERKKLKMKVIAEMKNIKSIQKPYFVLYLKRIFLK